MSDKMYPPLILEYAHNCRMLDEAQAVTSRVQDFQKIVATLLYPYYAEPLKSPNRISEMHIFDRLRSSVEICLRSGFGIDAGYFVLRRSEDDRMQVRIRMESLQDFSDVYDNAQGSIQHGKGSSAAGDLARDYYVEDSAKLTTIRERESAVAELHKEQVQIEHARETLIEHNISAGVSELDARLLQIAEEMRRHAEAASLSPVHVIFSVDPVHIDDSGVPGSIRRTHVVMPDGTGNTVRG